MDGPDVWRYYWHVLRIEKLCFSTHGHHSETLVVWGGFSQRGKTELVVLDGNQTPVSYISMLQEHLLPFIAHRHEGDCILQQDNTPVHVSYTSETWLLYRNIKYLDWSARSQDINPTKNLWGILARCLYQNGRSFNNKEGLENFLLDEWNKINTNLLKSFVNSMPKRCISLINNSRRHITY